MGVLGEPRGSAALGGPMAAAAVLGESGVGRLRYRHTRQTTFLLSVAQKTLGKQVLY
jgi:hypothetical protein